MVIPTTTLNGTRKPCSFLPSIGKRCSASAPGHFDFGVDPCALNFEKQYMAQQISHFFVLIKTTNQSVVFVLLYTVCKSWRSFLWTSVGLDSIVGFDLDLYMILYLHIHPSISVILQISHHGYVLGTRLLSSISDNYLHHDGVSKVLRSAPCGVDRIVLC